jgi:hypothetical protein
MCHETDRPRRHGWLRALLPGCFTHYNSLPSLASSWKAPGVPQIIEERAESYRQLTIAQTRLPESAPIRASADDLILVRRLPGGDPIGPGPWSQHRVTSRQSSTQESDRRELRRCAVHGRRRQTSFEGRLTPDCREVTRLDEGLGANIGSPPGSRV